MRCLAVTIILAAATTTAHARRHAFVRIATSCATTLATATATITTTAATAVTTAVTTVTAVAAIAIATSAVVAWLPRQRVVSRRVDLP